MEEALLARGTVHASGQVLCFESGGVPWKEHLYALERQHSVDPLVMFVMYTDQAGMWRMQVSIRKQLCILIGSETVWLPVCIL